MSDPIRLWAWVSARAVAATEVHTVSWDERHAVAPGLAQALDGLPGGRHVAVSAAV